MSKYNLWVSIPELGEYLDTDQQEAAEVLRLLGLRWHDEMDNIQLRDDVFSDGLARLIERNGETLIQWNYHAIYAMIGGTFPQMGWHNHVEKCEYEEITNKMTRQLNLKSGREIMRQMRRN